MLKGEEKTISDVQIDWEPVEFFLSNRCNMLRLRCSVVELPSSALTSFYFLESSPSESPVRIELQNQSRIPNGQTLGAF